MSSSSKGVRLLNAIKHYVENFQSWDKASIFSKIDVISMEDGKVVAKFRVTEDISNMSDSLHGGFTGSLIDTLCAFGVMSHSRGALALTTNVDVCLMSQALKGDLITVNIAPLSITRTRAIMEAYLINCRNNELVAKGTVSLHIPHKPLKFWDKFPFDPKLQEFDRNISTN